jgi:hypothetical protein
MKTALLITDFSSRFPVEKRADKTSSFCFETKQQGIFPLKLHSYILSASHSHFVSSHNHTLCDFKFAENVGTLWFGKERSFAYASSVRFNVNHITQELKLCPFSSGKRKCCGRSSCWLLLANSWIHMHGGPSEVSDEHIGAGPGVLRDTT